MNVSQSEITIKDLLALLEMGSMAACPPDEIYSVFFGVVTKLAKSNHQKILIIPCDKWRTDEFRAGLSAHEAAALIPNDIMVIAIDYIGQSVANGRDLDSLFKRFGILRDFYHTNTRNCLAVFPYFNREGYSDLDVLTSFGIADYLFHLEGSIRGSDCYTMFKELDIFRPFGFSQMWQTNISRKFIYWNLGTSNKGLFRDKDFTKWTLYDFITAPCWETVFSASQTDKFVIRASFHLEKIYPLFIGYVLNSAFKWLYERPESIIMDLDKKPEPFEFNTENLFKVEDVILAFQEFSVELDEIFLPAVVTRLSSFSTQEITRIIRQCFAEIKEDEQRLLVNYTKISSYTEVYGNISLIEKSLSKVLEKNLTAALLDKNIKIDYFRRIVIVSFSDLKLLDLPLGDIEVGLNFNLFGSVSHLPMKFCRNKRTQAFHPHINSLGEACLANFAPEFYNALSKWDFKKYKEVLQSFLTSCNMNSAVTGIAQCAQLLLGDNYRDIIDSDFSKYDLVVNNISLTPEGNPRASFPEEELDLTREVIQSESNSNRPEEDPEDVIGTDEDGQIDYEYEDEYDEDESLEDDRGRTD